jgi:hypothetical protein
MAETGLQTIVFTTQAGNVYLKPAGTFERYVWGGNRMRLDEIQDALGDVSTTTKFNARGGVQRDSLLKDIPGVVTTSIVMKHEQADRMKSELAADFWHVDKRMHVEGRDRDAPDKWVEIRRLMWGKATQRTDPATSWEAEEEGLITIPWSALDAVDIYPVNYADGSTAILAEIIDVHAAIAGESVPASNLLYAVSPGPAAGDPSLLVNTRGGVIANWEVKTQTGEASTPISVLGLGDFVFINYGTKVSRSDDQGDTFVDITHADWAANNMAQMDAIDQSFILGCGASGTIFASYDGARTWETLVSATASPTSEDLTRIAISRNNPSVAFAIGQQNAIIKTENGGFTWFSVTGPIAATDLLGIHVNDENSILILAANGLVYQTDDGGTTWIAQGALPGVTGATFARGDIQGAEGDVYYLFLSDATNGEHVLRSVEAGADGYWERVDQSDAIAESLHGLAVTDTNVCSLVGGTVDTTSLVATVA